MEELEEKLDNERLHVAVIRRLEAQLEAQNGELAVLQDRLRRGDHVAEQEEAARARQVRPDKYIFKKF